MQTQLIEQLKSLRLRGMAERASLLGGTLRAGPDPDGGWSGDASLPHTVRAS